MTNEEIIFIAGQIVGIIAFLISLTRYFMRKKKDIIKISIICYIIYVIHYFMIGAIAGSYSLMISLVRDLYLYQREMHHKKHRHRKIYNNWLFFVVFFMAYVVMMVLSINNPLNILPPLGGLYYLCYEWFTTNKTTLKIASSISNVPWIFYDVISMSAAGMISNTISLIVAFMGISKDKKLRKHIVKHNH